MSGSAAPDGSPAPVAFNLGQFVALGVMKGMPAADAMTVARGVVTNWVKTGQMDQQHADDMLADLGETAMRVANLNNAGALQRQGMIEEGADRRLPPTFIPDEGHPGSGTFVSPVGGDFRKPGGMRGGSPTPLSTDQNTAALQQQITNEPDPAKRAQLVQRLQQASPRPPPDEKEVYAARAMNYQSDNEAYPTPQKPPVAFHITAPIALRGDAQAAVDRRVQELMDQNRRLDLATAHQQAVYQLQDEGVLYSPDEVTAMRQGTAANLYGRYDAQIQNYAPPGGKPSEHLMIGLKPKGQQGQQQQQPAQTSPPPTATTTPPPPSPAATPPGPPYRPMQDIFGGSGGSSGAPPVPFWQSYLNRPAASGPAPLTTQQMYGGVSTVPAAPAASTPAANQPIGKAAPNAQEGSIAYLNGRPVGIVRGGAVYPMPAETGPGGGG
jgi:hypothetical protein